MRRVVVIAPALCIVLTAGCGGGSRSQITTQITTQRADTVDPAGVLAITTPADGSTTMLRRLDADTLAPLSAGTDLGEYHGAWALSRDRRVLAVGTFARTGVRLIDPATLAITRDIPLPVAAVALGWVSARRIAVLLERGGVVVVEAGRGRIQRRWPLRYRLQCGASRQAVTPHGVIFAVTSSSGTPRLLRVDAHGRLRSVTLSRVRAPSGPRTSLLLRWQPTPAAGGLSSWRRTARSPRSTSRPCPSPITQGASFAARSAGRPAARAGARALRR